MPTAVDIITYIGIPLAVLGVLPTIYTCLKSFLTLREITRTLYDNGVVAITRSALLSGIVEIEIPRRSITPLDRGDPNYFALRKTRSHLKGGTWTIFEWKEMVIGVKSYRLQYHDELAQPQAEIDFEALVAFLLDRGAVPSQAGWADLRQAGLWTPAGTKLLLSPVSEEEVLSVALSDDSDGILSLGVNWKREWDLRSSDSLPPYWVRVNAPREGEDVLAKLDEIEAGQVGAMKEGNVKSAFLDDDSGASVRVDSRSPIRVRINATGIHESYQEDGTKHPTKFPLHHLNGNDSSAGFWFCCAATAFQAPQGGLWSFSIPAEIMTLARHSTVPCGIMVLLNTLTDEDVPAWRIVSNEAEAERFENHVKFMERSRQMNEEMRLPPAQRQEATMRRMQKENMEFHNDMRRKLMAQEQRREKELVEAVQSQKLPISIVAEANLKFLQERMKLETTPTLPWIVEQIMYGMLQNPGFAQRLAVMLDLWKSWTQSGGMAKSHYLAVKEDQVTFALASCVLAIMKDMVNEPMGSVVGDLQECLRMWKKVRLG